MSKAKRTLMDATLEVMEAAEELRKASATSVVTQPKTETTPAITTSPPPMLLETAVVLVLKIKESECQ